MKNKKHTLRIQYTSQFYKNNHIMFALAVSAMLLTSMLNLVVTWLLQQIVDTIAGTKGAMEFTTLVWITIGVLFSILLFKGFSYMTYPRFMKKAMQQYKTYAFSKLMKKNIASFSEESTARYLSAFSNDSAVIESNYLENIFDLILQIVLFTGSLAMMLWYSPVLSAIACVFFVPSVLVSVLAGKKLEPIERKISEKNENFTAALKDSLSGFPVIKSFKAEGEIIAQFKKVNGTVEQEKCEKRKLVTVIGALSTISGISAQFGTFLVGGWLAFSGLDISVGVLFVFLNLTANVIGPISQFPNLFSARKAALGLIDKLAEEMEENLREQGEKIPNCLQEGIELKNVSFGYGEDKEVLHGIDFKFEKGKSYAIVGASGSGKSTLLNLLMASYPTYSGEICYDKAELKNVSSDSLYDVVSMIQQNVFVFDASIRDNITMYHKFPKEDVEEAIRRSGLTELIEKKGEAYLCGENGCGLSGGEKQRISIARSLLKKSGVLLVDEATAALDTATAYHVTDSILNLDGITRIVVTHSLEKSLLERYDCILVLKDGRIENAGTFGELMEQKKYFYSLYTVSQ